MFSVNFSDMQKIGLGLVAFGLAFLALGVMLFFDKGLLAMGNGRKVFFLCGIVLIIGFEKTFRFFFQSHKLKGAAFFFGGIVLVLIGWPIIGMLVEAYGSFLLFGKLLPHVIMVLRGLPIIGNFLMLPGIKSVADKLSDDSQSPA